MGLASELGVSFGLGVMTPLGATCLLPLYPGFMSYLAGRIDGSRAAVASLGLVAAAGVTSFMLGIGILFTTVLQTSLNSAIESVSPPAFAALGALGAALLYNPELFSSMSVEIPRLENPFAESFAFGFLFGPVALPCNPGFIGVFLARSTLFSEPVASVANFGAFGLGIGLPLFAISAASSTAQETVSSFAAEHGPSINRMAGAVMVAVSVYYLFFVFGVFP